MAMTQLAVLGGECRSGLHHKLARAFAEVREDLVHRLSFLLGNHEDAQDAVQEAFLKCWRLQDAPGIRNYRAWLRRVAVNAARDLQRNAWRRRWRPLDVCRLSHDASR